MLFVLNSEQKLRKSKKWISFQCEHKMFRNQNNRSFSEHSSNSDIFLQLLHFLGIIDAHNSESVCRTDTKPDGAARLPRWTERKKSSKKRYGTRGLSTTEYNGNGKGKARHKRCIICGL